ncbi:1820_t:CDS:2 [Rhizophagus irregularis]|nr:1820_t:CDS:2 [Rhizophagus irregularis]
MVGFYLYPLYYILQSNAVCNEGCYHPKGKHLGKYQLKKFLSATKAYKIQASDEKDLEIDLFENNL